MKSKRKNRIKITLILIYLFATTVLVVNFSIARFKTTSNAGGVANASTWNFVLKKDEAVLANEFVINLADTMTENVRVSSGTIAPGSEGSFTLGIDCTGCQVGVEYSIELLSMGSTFLENIKFYKSPAHLQTDLISLDTKYTTTIDLAEIATLHTETIYWVWETSDSISDNDIDSSVSGQNMVLNVKVVGEQRLTREVTDTIFFDITPTGILTLNIDEAVNFENQVTRLDIPTEIDGVAVREIGPYAFASMESLRSVTISSPEIIIGQDAFSNCTYLTSVTISSDTIAIGDNAFDNCSNLNRVYYSGNITTIGGWAFKNCNSLSGFNIPSSVTSIGESAFYNCESLTSITIPSSLTAIDRWTFWGCKRVTNIVIPDNVITIGEGAFGLASALETVTFGVGVDTICDSAFYKCLSLNNLVIPNTVITVQNNAFGHCTSLTNVTVDTSSTQVDNLAFYGCSNLENNI